MSASLIAIRALHFWSVAVLIGGGGLLLLTRASAHKAGLRVVRAAAIVAGLSGVAWFAATFVGITGEPAAALRGQDWVDFLTAPFGPPWAVLLGLSLLSIVTCPARHLSFFLTLGVAFAIDQAWLGHAAAGTGTFGVTMLISYCAHIFAGFAWIGALTVLCLSFRAASGLREGLAAVSGAGLFVVAIILASGCLNAAAHLDGLAQLTTTPYGRLLLAKVSLVAVMLALAAYNRREALVFGNLRRLSISIGVETALGMLVLLLAAVLGISEPPT